MYTCQGCGGYLKFDIESQALKCDSCGTSYPVPDEKDQNMEAEYEAKIYTCPNCGGELMGDDNEAVVFCSFCGSSNVLTERYQKEKRPARIIPFKITKDRCKEIYAKHMKSAPFAPKEFKDPKFIDSFRGIYMPFYLYNADIDDDFEVLGETVESHGDDDLVTDYMFTGHVAGSFEGIPHDASSSFADDISESIVPYNEEDSQEFSTGYMSGFYADTADVDRDIYSGDVADIASEAAARIVDSHNILSGISVKTGAQSQIHPQIKETDIGLYPVWFLSYRNRNRVAYAAINGQTGKMALDIPVDVKKFFLFTLGMAIPIFVILNFIVTLTPDIMLMVAGAFDVVAAILAYRTQKSLSDALSGANDKGLGKMAQKNRTVVPHMVLLILAAVIATGIYFLDPVSDIPYYAVSLLCILVVVFAMVSLVRVYNTISTRPLPQFKRRGGDDRA